MTRPRLARDLVQAKNAGVLSTHSLKHAGWPFGSLVAYAVDGKGRPLFLTSRLALHTKNLLESPKATLLVAESYLAESALSAPRATLIGVVAPIPAGEIAEARELYLERHPAAAEWVDFGDFAFFRMEIHDVYYIGGFGEMGWITGHEYGQIT